MKQRKTLLFTLVALGALFTARLVVSARSAESSSILEFSSAATVTAPFTGPTNPIRGVPGGGLPWAIGSIHGELKADGKLEINVDSLTLANDPLVPANQRLTNPLSSFRALVSCQSFDANKLPTIVNTSTDAFPASPAGDSEIETTITLPTHCFAPVVFVTSPGGAWLAVTGR
jgi:hypothetical protein